MIRKTLTAAALIAAVAVPLAGAATAQGYTAGERQLALAVGVEPGVYSLSQLSVLANLQSDDTANQAQIAYILNNPHGTNLPVTRAAANFEADTATPAVPSSLGSLAD